MTYKIGKGDLFTRLIRRFKLLTVEQVPPLLFPTVQPITNADEYCKTLSTYTFTFNTGGGGAAWINVGTVPAGKRWTVKAATISIVGGTANATFSSWTAVDITTFGVNFINKSASSTITHVLADGEVIINEKQNIYVYVSSEAVQGTALAKFVFYEEDAF